MADKEVQRTDIIIEGSTARWEISLEGDIQGLYTGSFRFRCFLSPTQHLAASREYRHLLGDNPTLVLTYDDNLAYALSQLKYRVIEAPPFWNSTVQTNGMPGDIPDAKVLDAILQAAVDAELLYRAQLKKKKAEALDKAKKAAERILSTQDEEPEDDEAET